MYKASKFTEGAGMRHFQIRMTDRHGCGSFLYFSAQPNKIGEEAARVADAWMAHKLEDGLLGVFNSFKPQKSAQVVEYDRQTKHALKGGLKFKIRLLFTQIKTQSALYPRQTQTIRSEWYEADEIEFS